MLYILKIHLLLIIFWIHLIYKWKLISVSLDILYPYMLSIVLNIHNLEMKTIQPRKYRKLCLYPACFILCQRPLSIIKSIRFFSCSCFTFSVYTNTMQAKPNVPLLCRQQAIIMLFAPCLSYLIVYRSPSAVPPFFTQWHSVLCRQTAVYPTALKSFFLSQQGWNKHCHTCHFPWL